MCAITEGVIKSQPKTIITTSQDNKDVAIRIPLGAWGLDGSWSYNPNLNISKEEQYRKNINNGFIVAI